MTSSNENIFRVTGHFCGEFTGPRWIPHTKASDAEFDKQLSKQSWDWWLETLSRPLWRHHNEDTITYIVAITYIIAHILDGLAWGG